MDKKFMSELLMEDIFKRGLLIFQVLVGRGELGRFYSEW